MSIPIVCYAIVEPDQRHRFAVARVSPDLVCTACGSDDIDLDEREAAKTATGRPMFIALDAMAAIGNRPAEEPAGATYSGAFLEAFYQAAFSKGFPNSYDQSSPHYKAGAEDGKAAGQAWFHDGTVNGVVITGSKTASGPIRWTSDTHMGVGFLVGLGPNDSVYEVYSNPNSNPTPCSWARYGPDGDTGPNSVLESGRGFATMQEAVAAAEANAAQQTTASKTASGPIAWESIYKADRYNKGKATNGDNYSIDYVLQGSQPVFAWTNWGPKFDSETAPINAPNFGQGHGFATMEWAMRAAETHASGAPISAWGSKTAGEVNQRSTCKGCGSPIVLDGYQGWLAIDAPATSPGAQPGRPVALRDMTWCGGANGTTRHQPSDFLASRHTADFKTATEKTPNPDYDEDARAGTSDSYEYIEDDDLNYPRSRPKTAYNDMEMAEVNEVASVTQKVTCSTCLTDHVVTSVDPAQPMPECPNCGALTLSPGGSTLASRRTASVAFGTEADYQEGIANFGSGEPRRSEENNTLAYIMGIANGNNFASKPEEMPTWGQAKLLLESQGFTATRKKATPKVAEADGRVLSPDFEGSAYCWYGPGGLYGDDVSEVGFCDGPIYWVKGESPRSAICEHHAKQRAQEGWMKAASVKFSAKARSKITEITRGVMATNSGMNEVQARKIAIKTVQTYPQVIKGN